MKKKTSQKRVTEAEITPQTLRLALHRANRHHARLSATTRFGDLMRVSGQVLRIRALLQREEGGAAL